MLGMFCLGVGGVTLLVTLIVAVHIKGYRDQEKRFQSLPPDEQKRGREEEARAGQTAVKCCVCGTPQKPYRLKRCMECGGWFCSFPPWKSPREKLDEVAGVFALILGVVLTAVTVVGGLIVLAILALPYVVFRELFPGPNKLPPYWKQCGGEVYGPLHAAYRTELLGERCNNCGGALPAIYPPSSSIDTSADDDYGPDGPDDHDSDDDGSFWDGWLVKL